jgi:hypothetical protein
LKPNHACDVISVVAEFMVDFVEVHAVDGVEAPTMRVANGTLSGAPFSYRCYHKPCCNTLKVGLPLSPTGPIGATAPHPSLRAAMPPVLQPDIAASDSNRLGNILPVLWGAHLAKPVPLLTRALEHATLLTISALGRSATLVVQCPFFEQKFTLVDTIEFHAFAPLEALT